MFAEPTYLRAYQRGVFAAARVFCIVYADGKTPAPAWPYPKAEATSLVADMAPAGDPRMQRRLATLAYAGARNEWRHLAQALRRQSGLFVRADAAYVSVRKLGA